jgi:hypothetical protein
VLVEEVIAAARELRDVAIEELRLVDERVVFKLPRELRTPA